jgi:hypothetical protein
MADVVKRANFKPVALTPLQQKKWDETLAAVTWLMPSVTHLLYSMLVPKGRTIAALFTEELPAPAATDGFQLIFKPSVFFEYPLMKRVFAVGHEVMHNVFDHCGAGSRLRKQGVVTREGKSLPYNPMIANVVQDLIINDGLIESKIGEFDKSWLHDPKTATHRDSWVDVYFKVYKDKKGGGGKGQGSGSGMGKPSPSGGSGNQPGNEPPLPGPGQFDMHLDPGSGGNNGQEEQPLDGNAQNQPDRSEQEWQQAVAAAAAVGKAQGKLPAAMELMFGQCLEPVIDWKDHVRSLIMRTPGSGGYDFRKADRRLIVRDIVAPGRSGFGAGVIVLGLDSSGSIYCDPTLIDRWLGELTGIISDLVPREVHVVWCDAAVQRVDVCEDVSDIETIRHKGAKGGGGTSFVPVFQYIEENDLQPDALIYLTDGYGEFPSEQPRYAVIWGNITKGYKYPFGEVVDIPVETQ